MKDLFKIALLLLFVFYACSDDEPEETVYFYAIIIETECGVHNTRNNYCVTQAEWERVDAFVNSKPQNGCLVISFTDKQGDNYTGYLRAGGRTDLDYGCN